MRGGDRQLVADQRELAAGIRLPRAVVIGGAGECGVEEDFVGEMLVGERWRGDEEKRGEGKA